MAISELQRIKNELERVRGGGVEQSPTSIAQTNLQNDKDKNKGKLLGGLGYIGEKLALGVVRGIEGVSDFLVGGVAD
jgi:hypothetical protein